MFKNAQRNLGNPSQRLRNWCFTLNNPGTIALDEWGKRIFNSGHVRYLKFQLEKGANGTPHIQGYIEFTSPMRLNAVKKILPRAHLERRRGTAQQAADYCGKDDTRVDGPWEFGEISCESQGNRSDLIAVSDAIRKGASIRTICEFHTTSFIKYHRGIREAITIREASFAGRMADKKVVLIYGDTGGGKSTWVRTNYADGLYVKDGTHKWFDGYIDQSVVLIDDFAGGKSGFPCSAVLNIFDKWDCQVEIKGGMVRLQHDLMFVTTNIHPRDWYDFSDRQVHYKALARRISEVWTMQNYTPVVLKKEEFFESFSGFDNYPISLISNFLRDEEETQPMADSIEYDEIEPISISSESSSSSSDSESSLSLDLDTQDFEEEF